ncbi:unnamed protein product [Euphydryas editha]|uniref:Uncharacterized protein n=1 Tax=Euphydryas editha TaxID=104508 RepID=A0AAU9TGY4_EUPED|nr:unnamed protein product [Euphydryas editha]
MGVTTQTQAFFHQKSMQTYKAPSTLNEKSLFGYSIAYESNLQSLIVSAPKADDIGKIYTININTSMIKEVHVPIDRWPSVKHDFWLGATVKSNADNFVTCIPRYAEFKTKHATVKKPATVGVCYVKNKNAEISQLKSMTNKDRNFKTKMIFKKRMDSFGWSIEVTSKNELLIGAPAVHTGRVLRYNKLSTSVTPHLIRKISYENPVTNNFGYSISSGNFFSDEISYAVSTTFGEIGYGKVYFFNSKLANIGAINDDELGSMFGASLCSANLGGVALLVGAPAYADSDYTYDIGAVYIYKASSGSSSNEMSLKRMLKGKSNGAYFGNAIVNLGDMDGDSKDEIAIAAPYDDNGRGAVYIYTGEGILQGKEAKKIQPEGLITFGNSLTVVEDFDKNGCNELAVSSINNSSIFLLRGVASVTVTLYTKFPNLKDHKNKTYFEFQSCLHVVYPEKPNDINADVIVTIVKTDPISKLIDADEKGVLTYEVSLRDKNESYCKSIGVLSQLTPVKEYNQVIAYKISVALKENPLERNDFDISRVILSERSILDKRGEESITDCGGAICVPILKPSINSSMSSPYLIGSSDMENFAISIQNIGQTAYGACVLVNVLEASIRRPPPQCIFIKDSTQFLQCTPDKPLRNKDEWLIGPIQVETTLLTSENNKLTIRSDLYNNCNNQTDKKTEEYVFDLKTDFENIYVKGQANPEKDVNLTKSDVTESGKNMEHVYTVHNNGKTNLIGVKSEIFLDNVPYVNYSGAPITILKDKSSGIECPTINSSRTETQIKVLCDIGDLKRNQKVQIVIAITIPPNTLEFKEENENVTITTTLNLILNNEKKSSSLETVVRFITVPVDLWIIIVSSLVGLILLVVICYALNKGGFLQRKNKEKLKKLKIDVHRQSMVKKI